MRPAILTLVILLSAFGNVAVADCTFNDGNTETVVSACPQNGRTGVCRYKDGTIDMSVTRCPHDLAEAYLLKASEAYTQKDASGSIHWYRMAAELGNAQAEFAVGNSYYLGLGVPKDVGEAIHWYRKAADQGNALAQNEMGGMYWRGEGVPKDVGEAVRWYRKTIDKQADADHADAELKYAIGEAQYALDMITNQHHARQPLAANGDYPSEYKEMPPEPDCKGIMAHRCYSR
jgi:TPR repeat protein